MEAAATIVNLWNLGKPAKAEPTVRVTHSGARAAAERAAAQERRDRRLAKRVSEERTGGLGSARRVPQAVSTGTSVFIGTAKPEARMAAAEVAGVPSNLTLEKDIRPNGREGKYVQSN